MGLSLLLYRLLYRGNGIVTTYQIILERNFHLLLLFFQETVQMFRSNAVPALSPAFPKVPEHHFRPECFSNHICKIRWCLVNVTGTLWAHKPQKSIDVLHREVLRLIFFFSRREPIWDFRRCTDTKDAEKLLELKKKGNDRGVELVLLCY